jgi:cytochrome c553
MFALSSELPQKYFSRALSCRGVPRASGQAVVLALLVLFACINQSHEVAADPEAVKVEAASCAGCHGEIGISETENVPPSLHDYKSGLRVGGGVAAMADVAYQLNDRDIAALAHYLSQL